MSNEKSKWVFLSTHSFIHSFIYLITAVAVVFLISFCSNQQVPEPTQQAQNQLEKTDSVNQVSLAIKTDSTKESRKDSSKTTGEIIVDPRSQNVCQKDVETWLFDHYETAPGKIVGIWAEDNTYSTNAYKLNVFHDTLGYNYIFTHEGGLNNVISAGYNRDHIMLGGPGCENPDWQQLVQNTKPVWAYYLDEQGQLYPCQTLTSWFYDFRIYLNNQGLSNTKIITGESSYDDFNCYNQSTNTIMCTKYCIDAEWTCFLYDQRGRWTDFRNVWGAKFNLTWISSRLDNDEFDDLIGHASNLGLDGVWLFQNDDTQASEATERQRISNFSLNAWKWGFLIRVERRWLLAYRCIYNPCTCDPNSMEDWVLINKYPTWETRTRTY